MTIRYVGGGGSDASNGLSWANRKLTLNGVEDTPVVAGDTVYVGPGVYRELLTVDVSGTAGNPIEYLADVTGRLTDGIGGVVRITGSDNDQSATRANCVTATSKNYRTFTGFAFDTPTSHLITFLTACSNWIIQDCYFGGAGATAINQINAAGTGTNNTIRRCVFFGGRSLSIQFTHSSTVDNSGHLIENCLFLNSSSGCIWSVRVGGITVKNCTFLSGSTGVRVQTALSVGQTTTVNNNIIAWCATALQATVTGEITENYNTLWGNNTDRTNVSSGANSVTYPPLLNPFLLLSGLRLPNLPLPGLSVWSALRAIAGSSESSEDMFGVDRPATSSKKSWGAMQHIPMLRETGTVRTGAASLRLSDAGRHQMIAPITNVSTIFSVYVQWEADYAGTLPQLVVKQPGQSDQTDTATGSSGSWEELSVTVTPAVNPPYVIVELVSNNTGSGNIDTFFDDFTIS